MVDNWIKKLYFQLVKTKSQKGLKSILQSLTLHILPFVIEDIQIKGKKEK